MSTEFWIGTGLGIMVSIGVRLFLDIRRRRKR
jgi:hypothetical protein